MPDEKENHNNKKHNLEYTINSEQLMDIMRYLMTRPYGEVVKLMNTLSTLNPQGFNGGDDARKKK